MLLALSVSLYAGSGVWHATGMRPGASGSGVSSPESIWLRDFDLGTESGPNPDKTRLQRKAKKNVLRGGAKDFIFRGVSTASRVSRRSPAGCKIFALGIYICGLWCFNLRPLHLEQVCATRPVGRTYLASSS